MPKGGDMSIQKLLVPYNFTSHDQKSLDFVIRHFAHQGNIEVTLFSVYSPIPEIKSVGSPIMEQMKRNLIYLSQKNNELEAALVEAQSTLIKGGFPQSQVKYSFTPRKTDIANEIIRMVRKENFNLVVVNHKPGKATHLFTGNVFSKVVNALKNTVICVVT
jgi:nucleotide-binding universal stress UspA family protein